MKNAEYWQHLVRTCIEKKNWAELERALAGYWSCISLKQQLGKSGAG